jgi:hypothetical protein
MKSGVQHQENLWAFQKFVSTHEPEFPVDSPLNQYIQGHLCGFKTIPIILWFFNLWKITVSN